MATKQQLTGMRGVYLVASELSKLGFVVSPTSRNAAGTDLLVTDQNSQKTYSVQVKANIRTFSFWLLSKKAKEIASDVYIYVLVNIRKKGENELIEYYIVPSSVVSKNTLYTKNKSSEWYFINLKDVQQYRNKWEIFEKQ